MNSNRRKSSAGRVWRAASALQADEREVLRLSATEGLSNSDIGERLSLSDEEVVRLLARALCNFADALEKQERPWWHFW